MFTHNAYMQLVHISPATVLGMLYATMMGVGGAIFGRVFVALKPKRSFLDIIL